MAKELAAFAKLFIEKNWFNDTFIDSQILRSGF